MSKPFDAAVKDLIQTYPADWLRQLGLPGTNLGDRVRLVDADLSTVTTVADKIIQVYSNQINWLLHLELQASRDILLAARTLQYNVLLHTRHNLPVQSVIILLRKEADDSSLTGQYRYAVPGATGAVEFRYHVVRLWERPVEEILAGGAGTLPLAPLSAINRKELPAIIRRMDERISAELDTAEAHKLWTSTYVLMGLKYSQTFAAQLLRGVMEMKESVTYQAIIAEGEAKGEIKGRIAEARAILLRQGTKRFGTPSAAAQTKLENIKTLEYLELLTDRILEVETWSDLLA